MAEEAEKQLDIDLKTLSRTELSQKYRKAFNSWKNRKSAAKKVGNWDPAFDDFGNFLRIMRAPPSPNHTLDRDDNCNPLYGPGLCSWKNKREQANNRSTTIVIDHEGVTQPLSDVARSVGRAPSQIRRDFHAGRLDTTGWRLGERPRTGGLFGKDPFAYKPWPYTDNREYRIDWEEKFHLSRGSRLEKQLSPIGRFDFLIRELSKEIGRLNDAMRKEIEAGDPDIDVLSSISANQKRVQSCLDEANIQHKMWQDACRIANSKKRSDFSTTTDYDWGDVLDID